MIENLDAPAGDDAQPVDLPPMDGLDPVAAPEPIAIADPLPVHVDPVAPIEDPAVDDGAGAVAPPIDLGDQQAAPPAGGDDAGAVDAPLPPAVDGGAGDGIVTPPINLDDAGAGQVAEPPLDDAGAGQVAEPPLDDAGAGQVAEPPLDDAGAGQVAEPPVDDAGAGQVQQPVDGGVAELPDLDGDGQPDPGVEDGADQATDTGATGADDGAVPPPIGDLGDTTTTPPTTDDGGSQTEPTQPDGDAGSGTDVTPTLDDHGTDTTSTPPSVDPTGSVTGSGPDVSGDDVNVIINVIGGDVTVNVGGGDFGHVVDSIGDATGSTPTSVDLPSVLHDSHPSMPDSGHVVLLPTGDDAPAGAPSGMPSLSSGPLLVHGVDPAAGTMSVTPLNNPGGPPMSLPIGGVSDAHDASGEQAMQFAGSDSGEQTAIALGVGGLLLIPVARRAIRRLA